MLLSCEIEFKMGEEGGFDTEPPPSSDYLNAENLTSCFSASLCSDKTLCAVFVLLLQGQKNIRFFPPVTKEKKSS